AARAEGEIRFAWPAAQEFKIGATADIRIAGDPEGCVSVTAGTLPPLCPTGSLKATFEGRRFALTEAQFSLGQASLRASGFIGLDKDASVDLSYESPDSGEALTHLGAAAKLAPQDVDGWKQRLQAR